MCITLSEALDGAVATGRGHGQVEHRQVMMRLIRAVSQSTPAERIYSLGWRARVSTLEGIQHTYPWIEGQVRKARAGK